MSSLLFPSSRFAADAIPSATLPLRSAPLLSPPTWCSSRRRRPKVRAEERENTANRRA